MGRLLRLWESPSAGALVRVGKTPAGRSVVVLLRIDGGFKEIALRLKREDWLLGVRVFME